MDGLTSHNRGNTLKPKVRKSAESMTTVYPHEDRYNVEVREQSEGSLLINNNKYKQVQHFLVEYTQLDCTMFLS